VDDACAEQTEIALGRGFTSVNDEHATHNVIVGYDIVDNILGPGDPIGKEIRVDGIPYTIAGVGARLGKMLAVRGQLGAVPLSTYQQTTIQRFCGCLCARRRRCGSDDSAEDEVRVLMRSLRHDAPYGRRL